jgi:hypothetical protein
MAESRFPISRDRLTSLGSHVQGRYQLKHFEPSPIYRFFLVCGAIVADCFCARSGWRPVQFEGPLRAGVAHHDAFGLAVADRAFAHLGVGAIRDDNARERVAADDIALNIPPPGVE